MKKLVPFSPEIARQLEAIGKAIEQAEESDPERYTYVCPDCQDTGFTITERTHRFMGGPYTVGIPCEECMAGMRIAERMQAERDAKPVRALKPRNERIRLLPRAPSDYTGEEPPF